MTERLEAAVAVLGAGPAGLSAATAAARSGASVIVLDLYAKPGGQYHMQPRADLHTLTETTQAKAGAALADEVRAAGARILTETELFWARPGFELFANRKGEAIIISARQLIVASGAIEIVNPFPGWTLPGVTTAGAAQRLVKSGARFEGRTVLAGSGPFLLAVAATFAKAAIPIEAMVEEAGGNLQRSHLLGRYPERAVEAIGLAAAAGRARRLGLHRHAVVEAIGKDRLDAVRIAPLDREGDVNLASSRVLTGIDRLCISHGFRPNVEVTTLLGARHGFDPAKGGWFCDSTLETGQTSLAGLRAAGETTGIAGARAAVLSGTLAGLAAAAEIGFETPPAFSRSGLARRLRRVLGFAHALASAWPAPPPRFETMTADTFICRCEDVTRADIEAAIDEGARESIAIKMWTRAGMGPCQGRICGAAIAALAAHRLACKDADIGVNRPHLPLRPTPLAVVAAAVE